MSGLKKMLKDLLPQSALGAYHLSLAYLSAALYLFPSRSLIVIGVTGTKGKSSTTEMLNAMFEEAGLTTALVNSIRFKVGNDTEPNETRMSMPGRFFMQRFLRRAKRAGCKIAIIEMTSEGARQHRHRGIDMDALIFTNLAPEHIESHGSFEAYADAKFQLGLALARSRKRPRVMIANIDDPEAIRYLALPVEHVLPFSLPPEARASESGGQCVFDGTLLITTLPGLFNLKNALAAATTARAFGVETSVIVKALHKLSRIPGRAESIDEGQEFPVVVDYAHTPDSLRALYEAYAARRRICVLGATGGGRDSWKRPVMGAIADEQCEVVILTDEDPYDEDPRAIVEAIARGMKRRPEIIMDRKQAIEKAISLAQSGSAVLITGKGTDPTIALAGGAKMRWSDAAIAREALRDRAKKPGV